MGDDKNSRSGMRSDPKFYSSYLAKKGSIFVRYTPRLKLRKGTEIVQLFELLSKSPNLYSQTKEKFAAMWWLRKLKENKIKRGTGRIYCLVYLSSASKVGSMSY